MPTATSIVADLVAVVKNMKLGVNGRQAQLSYKVMKLKTDEQIASKFFLLLHVEDRAGVLAQIAQVFSDCDVSIESVMQPSAPNKIEHGNHHHHARSEQGGHEQSAQGFRRAWPPFAKIKSVYRVEG